MRVLITGANGMLGRSVSDLYARCGAEVHALGKGELDVSDRCQVADILRSVSPAAVVNCAAFTNVDEAESAVHDAFRVNALGSQHLAHACREVGARYVYPSTDYVFDGSATVPYRPTAGTRPVNSYGRSKLAGERAARAAQDFLVVRTSWLYGTGGRNFVRFVATEGRAGRAVKIVNDQRGSPTWAPDLAKVIYTLIEKAPPGVYHATNAGDTTWYEFALEIAAQEQLAGRIEPITTVALGPRAPRPAYSVLNCSGTEQICGPLRPWQAALREALQTHVY